VGLAPARGGSRGRAASRVAAGRRSPPPWRGAHRGQGLGRPSRCRHASNRGRRGRARSGAARPATNPNQRRVSLSPQSGGSSRASVRAWRPLVEREAGGGRMPRGDEPRLDTKRPTLADAARQVDPQRRSRAIGRCPQFGGGSAEPPLSNAGAASTQSIRGWLPPLAVPGSYPWFPVTFFAGARGAGWSAVGGRGRRGFWWCGRARATEPRRAALRRGAIAAGVGPLRKHRPDEALGLAVGLRPLGPCAGVL
jgi:hypothetical protein